MQRETLLSVLRAKIEVPQDRSGKESFFSLLAVLGVTAVAPGFLCNDYKEGTLDSVQVSYWMLLVITTFVSVVNSLFEDFTMIEEEV